MTYAFLSLQTSRSASGQNASSCISCIARMYRGTSASKSDTEDKKLMNTLVIFILMAHKKDSCSFITLRLKNWCNMDCFNDVLTTFLGLERVSCVAVYAGSESSRISSNTS